jgi:hypothetical protein
MRSPAAPRYARPFVAVFLTAIVLCGLAAVNAWPFSNWELFSRLRSDRMTAWEEIAVSASGDRDAVISSVPHAFDRLTARGFSKPSAVCAGWLQRASHDVGEKALVVRVYHLNWLLSDRRGSHAAPPHRTLKLVCTVQGTA